MEDALGGGRAGREEGWNILFPQTFSICAEQRTVLLKHAAASRRGRLLSFVLL